jgi:hypothetical protein
MNQYTLIGWDFGFLAKNPNCKNWPVEYPIKFPIQVTQFPRTFYSDNVIVGVPINGELVEFSLVWFIYEKLDDETGND